MEKESTQIDPSKIIQTGMGFWESKTLLTAVNLRLFTHLANGELSGREIKTELGLHERSLYDFLDALAALGFLKRRGLKENTMYSNADHADFFLDKNKPSYIGGILEMCNNRLYHYWNDLEEGLKTGKPQNEIKTGGRPQFEELYRDKEKTRDFIKAMGGLQMGNFIAFSRQFDFSDYKTLCDIGGGGAELSAQVVINNGHMRCVSFDLPPVFPVASENIENMGLTDKVHIQSGDFFKEDFPRADVVVLGNILHAFDAEEKKALIEKAYNALPEGGALVAIENVIDNDRRQNAFGLLMSLNMLIENDGGFNFTGDDFDRWAKERGFNETSVIPLTGPSSAVIAIK